MSLFSVDEDPGGITLAERVTPGLRLVLGLASLVPLLAPWELLVRPAWQGPSALLALALLVSLGALALSALLLAGALLGLDQTLRLDQDARTIRYVWRTPLTAPRARRYAFADLVRVAVEVSTWDSGPDTFGLSFAFSDGQGARLGSFDSRDEAERWRARVEGLVRSSG